MDPAEHGAFLAVVRQDQWLDGASKYKGKGEPSRRAWHSGAVSAAERDRRADDDLGGEPGGECRQATAGRCAARRDLCCLTDQATPADPS